MLKEFENDEELIEVAAKACYLPEKSRSQLAMRYVIERLVLPEEIDSYSKEDMVEFIEWALEEMKSG